MCTYNTGTEEKERNIFEVFNKETFLKIKPVFVIDKILFSFVEMDAKTKERKSCVECYMKIADAALLARQITTGRMYRKLETEKKKGEKFPNAVWRSNLGGVSEADARMRNLRSDGKAISRHFTIAPGSVKYAVIKGVTCAGYSNEKGWIIPDMKDPEKITIRVALEDHGELEKLGIMLEAAVNAYMIQICSKK